MKKSVTHVVFSDPKIFSQYIGFKAKLGSKYFGLNKKEYGVIVADGRFFYIQYKDGRKYLLQSEARIDVYY